MDIQQLLQAMTPDIYARLRQAVETGKWPDGTALSQEQQQSSMQAVMLYQAKVLQSDEHMSVGADGDIVHKSRQQLEQEIQSPNSIARFKLDDI